MDNHFKYQEYRKTYHEFIYKGYSVMEDEEKIQLSYFFEVPKLSEFTPSWIIPKKKKKGELLPALKNVKEELNTNATLRKLIFSLGMVELVSYWKIACPPTVKIELNFGDEIQEEELLWWKEQYFHGLGEFFYTNGIALDSEGFMNLEINKKKAPTIEKKNDSVFEFHKMKQETSSIMIPIGGGKDSVVTTELLRSEKDRSFCFMINGRGATLATAEVAEFEEEHIIIVKRSLDGRMLDLNKAGYLNGHTPFSAIVAFSTVLVSYLYGISYIALSNEGSASESTVEGSTVNHQYSKSFKFEMDFYEYEKNFIKSGIHYFSLLRGWTEYRIAKNFAKHKSYHSIFRSCNVGSKENKWCSHCSKCLFVYLILGPFLTTKELTAIFHTNMLTDLSMLEDMRKLIGEVPEKPFECVGSREEVNIAVCETIRKMEEEGETLPELLQFYKETESYSIFKNRSPKELLGFSDEHNIPERFLDKVK